eukprot:TRINITY_DN9265_c1_g1_i2.p1 TRINITY_DN9265_c1_g1~~TRINITY_DN9265_c1_g1_i2.p1  ORF type:complete len:593 (+),score=82.65 TRINITY_DN9265_c1_g1_i2:85-1863(+)
MASDDLQLSNADFAPLSDSEHVRSRPTKYGKVALTLAALSGVLGLATLFREGGGAPPDAPPLDPEALSIVDLSSLQKPDSVTELAATPAHFAQLRTVDGFNDLLATSIVTDARASYDGMPKENVEALFHHFLTAMGTEVPDSAGKLPDTPRSSYSSSKEYNYRLGIFSSNIFSIIEHNAEEYAHNHDVNRARFGITTHADWTKDEFESVRFNLKAANTSAYEAEVREARVEEPSRTADARPDFLKPVGLAADQCDISTGGSCWLFPCHASRGAECYGGECICVDGACAEGGKCVRPGNCEVSTGGSCHLFGCDSSRNAVCRNGDCVCAQGMCAKDGRCEPEAAPQSSSSTAFKCSYTYRGPVRSQGACGDCWAFSTAQQLRYMTFKKYNQDPGLMSVQYLVDCMPEEAAKKCAEGVKGCCGGLPFRADRWLESAGGLPTASDYGPLVSDQHPGTAYTCKSRVPKKVKPVGANIYQTEQDIANAFCEKGPVSVAINANAALQHYTGGVFTERHCPPQGINHAVLLTGFDTTFNNGHPVHIILNSWGSNWGVTTARPYRHQLGAQNGHVLFKYGENVCNVRAIATAPQDVRWLR